MARRRRSTRGAFAVGYAVIAWLLRHLVAHTVRAFVAYRISFGTLILVLVAAGVIECRPSLP